MSIEQEHKELHNKIYNCKCQPWNRGTDYCLDCEQAVVGFMNRNGAGELCQDLLIESLRKEINVLQKETTSLSQSLMKSRARVVELKEDPINKPVKDLWDNKDDEHWNDCKTHTNHLDDVSSEHFNGKVKLIFPKTVKGCGKSKGSLCCGTTTGYLCEDCLLEQDAPSDELKDIWGNVVTGDDKENKKEINKDYENI